MDLPARQGDNREAGWVNRLFTREGSTPEYQELKFLLHRKLLDRINLEALSSMAGDRVRAEIRVAVASWWTKKKRRSAWWKKIGSLKRSWTRCSGWGRWSRCAGSDDQRHLVTTPKLVYVERAGKLYGRRSNSRTTRTCCASSKNRLASGRRVDESSPLVDARLPDGSRVNAAIPPVAVDGPLLSIRRFGRHGMKGEDLVTKLSLTEGMLNY